MPDTGRVVEVMSAAQLARLLGDWAPERGRLPEALAEAIIELVDKGYVPAGITLPAQRDLAAALGLSRGTVATAVSLLAARGCATSRRGSGTRVRSAKVTAQTGLGGRLFSFTNSAASLADLSSGALPASRVAREVLAAGVGDLSPYLDTDGYFPAGLPVLRQAIADYLTRWYVPTSPSQVLVTSGAQQATQLAVRALVGQGDLALCDDPTYRGALEIFNAEHVRAQGVPVRDDGLDLDLLRQALRRHPEVLYCQTGVHNPTGRAMRRSVRADLAGLVNEAGLRVIEDCCSADLVVGPRSATTLAGMVEPDLLVSCGTMSKLFWGGLRVGWIRSSAAMIRLLTEIRKAGDLATSVVDQLLAVRMLMRADEARAERRLMLEERVASTEQILRGIRPGWTWRAVDGGSCLWVDTAEDALQLAERARRVGVKLAPGPGFSPHDGHRTMLRIPVAHDPAMLSSALQALDEQ